LQTGWTKAARHAVAASYLGWTLDAFDFFVLTFVITDLAAQFKVSIPQIAIALTLTLLFRPIGAFIFGRLADNYGRRHVFAINIACYSVFAFLTAFAPSLTSFLVIRSLFGIAMGGIWGVGAALALETLPAQGRGFFSGLLQEGYVIGNLLAAALYGLLFSHLHGTGYFVNWRVMFMIGALPSLLVFHLRFNVEESPAWLAAKAAKLDPSRPAPAKLTFAVLLKYLPTFLFLVVLMFAFTSFSHGTQDLYPTFLQDHGLSAGQVGLVAAIGNVGALMGGVFCGTLSERLGRRKTIVLAALLAIPMVPLWAWSHTMAMLALGGFLMQFMVQGAWGIIPAHLNELCPAPVRAIMPGFAYQLGNLLSSLNSVFQENYAKAHNHGVLNTALSGTVVLVAILVAIIAGLGPEAKGSNMTGQMG